MQFRDKHHLNNYLKQGNFAIMTGHSHKVSPQDSSLQHQNMMSELHNAGYQLTPVQGKWGGVPGEPSVIVHNIHPDKAADIAKKYGQISHIQSSGGQHKEIAHAHDYEAPPGGKGHTIGDHEDNYSEVKLADGTKAKFQLDVGY